MNLSIIITTYNLPDSLLSTLISIEKQVIPPYEVVIADDGSSIETKEMIFEFQKKTNLKIIHSWQKDIGFRVARSRNKAILNSKGDYIVLVDGDMILHPLFISDHIKNAQKGFFTQGFRVLLGENISKKILIEKKINFLFFFTDIKNIKNAIHSNILSKIFSKKGKHIKGIKSCNMGFFREDFFNVNGFNNKFEGWGREDSELIARLLNSGILRKDIRFNAIQFHLWHDENTRDSLNINNEILKNSISSQSKWCEDGVQSVKIYEN
jgi:glycosyltransferase involved in cell wall biosynthesis